ncbi:hypothetical protein [Nocardioides baculatus]|uniref:Uncharacterized protein n=1 Tax=Nocardioides baculatus TaxID=2801337 RepID=A0ABS1LD18_9ACTN|nr:hypothetical protein [Nocardioides baculatus]MBL0749278.1 hypothetical protein [Nocardioides baculatus]
MTHFIGCIQVRPPLNEVERGYFLELLDSDRTLRGTPTGRGDADVPFARLGWEVCRDGCCLEWDTTAEDAKWMVETLRFVIDHLLRDGARAQGRARFDGFGFDHVLSGAVMGRGPGDRTTHFVTVADNVVHGRAVPEHCVVHVPRPRAASSRTRATNVIEFRPRRA